MGLLSVLSRMYIHGPTPGLNIICTKTLTDDVARCGVIGVGGLVDLACLDGPGLWMNGDAEEWMAVGVVVTVNVGVCAFLVSRQA
jgi:hypothetical protein